MSALVRGFLQRLHEARERHAAPLGDSAGTRALDRHVRIALTASSAAAAKIVSAAVQLAMVPMMLSALGDSTYGLWLTLQSLIGFGAFAELGVGNSALNAISSAESKGDRQRINSIISSALCILTVTAACSLIVGLLALDLLWLRGPESRTTFDIAAGIAVFIVYFALALPLSFIERVNAAFQEGFVTNIARGGVAAATLIATGIAVHMGGSFAMICTATLLPQLAGWTIVWLIELRRRHWISIGRRSLDPSIAHSLLGVGLLFLGVQVLAACNWSMDNLLISSLLGLEEVTTYAVQVRVFGLVSTITSIILAPLWPAYADAVAHGDHRWITLTLRRSLVGAVLISGPLAFGAAACLPWLLDTWTGDGIRTTPTLAYGLASLTVCQTVCAALAMFWNGTAAIRVQFLVGMALVALSLPLKVLVLYADGIEWLGFLSSALIVVTVFLPAMFLVRPASANRSGTLLADAAGS